MMTKTTKKYRATVEPMIDALDKTIRRQMHGIEEWKCHHRFDCSEIELYSELSGMREFNVSVTGDNHIALSEFIAHAANERNQNPNLLNDVLKALEQCLNSGKLGVEEERVV